MMKPGEIIVKKTEIEINKGTDDSETVITVKNIGDRPIKSALIITFRSQYRFEIR